MCTPDSRCAGVALHHHLQRVPHQQAKKLNVDHTNSRCWDVRCPDNPPLMQLAKQPTSHAGILDAVTDKVIKSNANHYSEAGGFADLHRCQFKGDTGLTEVAAKAFRFMFSVDDGEVDDKYVKAMRRELGIWERLDLPNIVPFLGVTYPFGRPGSASLVSLWMPNGTIRSFLSEHEDQLTLVHRLHLLSDIAQGLRYLTTESDIYSFGNMAFLMLSGQQPWSEVTRDAAVVYKLSQGHKPGRPKFRSVEDEHWQFIERCWSSINEMACAKE